MFPLLFDNEKLRLYETQVLRELRATARPLDRAAPGVLADYTCGRGACPVRSAPIYGTGGNSGLAAAKFADFWQYFLGMPSC